jgi:hypothetical protein
MKRKLAPWIGLIPILVIPLYPIGVVQRPESACDAEEFMTSGRPKVAIHPEKVIVQPWHGQHQVYGIFMLPDSISPKQPVLLQVKHVGTFCDEASYAGKLVQGVQARPGHYLMIDNIRTRTALWLIVQGKLDQLQQPTNWVLVYHQ